MTTPTPAGPAQTGGLRAPLKRAAAALARGDHKRALTAASEACHAAPGDPRAHYAYGQAWSALGKPALAERAFAEAVRLRPGWADAWINLGVERYRQGDIEAAKRAMLQALRREPGSAAAASNLAAFLRLTGAPEAAESILRATIETVPDAAGARLNLAAELIQEGRHAAALALLDGPAPADRAAARHWHLQRALAFVESGDLAGCRAAVEAAEHAGAEAPPSRPLLLWRRVLLARAEGDEAQARLYAAEMEAALGEMGPRAAPEHRIMGHYDLARLYLGWRDKAAAMRHWSAGHAILRQMQPFDRAADRAYADALIAAYPAARLQASVRDGDPAPVFIVGMPRSGTTLCEQILAAHPHAHGAGERAALGQAVARLGGGPAVAALDRAALDKAGADYLDELRKLAPDRSRIIDKLPGNYWHVGPAALLLPGAKFIHCVRDPRDIGLSIFTFRFYGYHPYAHDLADLGWAIGEQARLMAHWKSVLPAGAILTVRLDDWVHDFDGTLRRALGHIGLSHDPACARFYERTGRVRTVSRNQVREPVNARGLGRWRAFAPWLGPLIAELAQAGLLDEWAAAPVSV